MRVEKERRLTSTKSRRVYSNDEVDAREGRVTIRGPPSSRARRDRISPSDGSSKMTTVVVDTAETRRSRRLFSKGKEKHLIVETKLDTDEENYNNDTTPRTEASTPSSPSSSVRGQTDLRSPGQRKSTKVASSVTVPLPDFMTQTDKDGNAVTPRTATAIQQARVEHPSGVQPHLHVDKDGRLTEEQPVDVVDACTETFLDSIRIMCCCLLPDDAADKGRSAKQQVEEQKLKKQIVERPRLLPMLHSNDYGKKCLVLDLDETLVHSSFRAVPGADFVIPVQVRKSLSCFDSRVILLPAFSSPHALPLVFIQIEDVVHFVYVAKRPGVDEFLTEMAKHYEIIIYTASLNKYADPLLDLLDPNRVIRTRLFRESCVYYEGNYVKDLSLLDRDLSQSIIIDNSPSSYGFHPENAIDCSSFIDDPSDRELDQIGSFLKGLKDVRDVRGLTMKWRDWPNVSLDEQ